MTLPGVGAIAHDDDAADRLALAVAFGDAAPHVGTELHVGDLPEQNRHAILPDADGDFPEVVKALHVAAHAQDEFLFGQLDRAPSHLAIAALDGVGHAQKSKGRRPGASSDRP